MIKLLYFLLSFMLLTASLQAQEFTADKQELERGRVKPDSNFVKFLVATASAYSKSMMKNDSAALFLTEAIAVAEKINYTEGLMASREELGQYYFQKGRLTPALDLLLKNDALAIQLGDSTQLFSNLRLVASVYMRIGDINMARVALNRRQAIIDNKGIKGLKDTSYHVLSQYNSLAIFYNLPQVNMPDSSGYYFRKIYLLGKNTGSANLWTQLSNGGLGKYYTFKKMYDSAVYHFTIAKTVALEAKRFDNYFGFVVSLADAYRQSGQLDSAFKYAYRVYNDAAGYSYIGILASSSGLLANLYKEQHRYDSAIKYMGIESQYKDSISGQETLKNIQTLTSDQQLKEIEKKRQQEEAVKEYKATLRNYFFIGGLILLLLIIGLMYRVNKQRSQSKKEIETAYNDLKATQAQLIQAEKMASLGELTAGIAHEIQNPLNFVNNFSEVNKELLAEMNEEIEKGNLEEVKQIAKDITDNEEKINHHGKRADAIVKGMLQHSRSSTSTKEPTDINKLADEYLRLAYHGLRAKDKSFNATLKTDFDESIGKINIIPQDIGRVILNLITNAFYATSEKLKAESLKQNKSTQGLPTFERLEALYQPTVSVSTKKTNNSIEIKVIDNGNGIPQNIIDKIFQPFFTTKPTGQGTGLGLSLSYDIIKAHGGELKVATKGAKGLPGEESGAEFIIQLPLKSNL